MENGKNGRREGILLQESLRAALEEIAEPGAFSVGRHLRLNGERELERGATLPCRNPRLAARPHRFKEG